MDRYWGFVGSGMWRMWLRSFRVGEMMVIGMIGMGLF